MFYEARSLAISFNQLKYFMMSFSHLLSLLIFRFYVYIWLYDEQALVQIYDVLYAGCTSSVVRHRTLYIKL